MISLIPESPSRTYSSGSSPVTSQKYSNSEGGKYSAPSSATMVDHLDAHGVYRSPVTTTPGFNFNNENMMLMNGNYDLFNNVNFESILTDDALSKMFFNELNEFPNVFDNASTNNSNGYSELQGA